MFSTEKNTHVQGLTFVGLKCLRCGRPAPNPRYFAPCPTCLEEGIAVNFTCDYSYPAPETVRRFLQGPRPGMWRYEAMLPVSTGTPVSLGEGATPLVPCQRLGERWGIPGLHVKDETTNPTWSYKDRLSAVVVTKAMEWNSPAVIVSSTGNHGASTAAYAAHAGLPCVALTLAASPTPVKTQMQIYGAKLVAVHRSEDRWMIMAEAVQRFGWVPTSNYSSPPIGSNPYGIEGYKTLAYEIADQLAEIPTAVVMPTAYGDGIYGTWKGFRELHENDLAPSAPQMVAAEPFPRLARALETDIEVPEPVEPSETPAYSIGGGYSTYQALRALRDSGGVATHVSEGEIINAQLELAAIEGLYVEATSAVALAAAKSLSQSGRLSRRGTVVVVLTASGLKDPETTARLLPPVPTIAPSIDNLRNTLSDAYAFSVPS